LAKHRHLEGGQRTNLRISFPISVYNSRPSLWWRFGYCNWWSIIWKLVLHNWIIARKYR